MTTLREALSNRNRYNSSDPDKSGETSVLSTLLQTSTGSLFKDAIRAAFAVYIGKNLTHLLFAWNVGCTFSMYKMHEPDEFFVNFLTEILNVKTLFKYDKGRISRTRTYSSHYANEDVTKLPSGVYFNERMCSRMFVRIPFENTEFLLVQPSGIEIIDELVNKIIPVFLSGSDPTILYRNKDRDAFIRFTKLFDKYNDRCWRNTDSMFVPGVAGAKADKPSSDAPSPDGTSMPETVYGSYRWSAYQFKRPRKVFLDDLPINSTVREKIDVHIQWCKREWAQGNASHRAILLSGLPGTGKSSVAQAVGAELFAYLYEFPYQDTARGNFEYLIENIHGRSVVIADEIDTHFAFQNRIRDSEWGYNPNQLMRGVITSAGIDQKCIFDYLSGPKAPLNVLTIMITNYPKKIDPAIKREGRTKEEIFVGNVDHAGIVRWLNHVYNRPYEGPDFIDMPMKYIFSCKEDAYTYEELIEALHKYDPSKEQDVLRQEDALGG